MVRQEHNSKLIVTVPSGAQITGDTDGELDPYLGGFLTGGEPSELDSICVILSNLPEAKTMGWADNVVSFQWNKMTTNFNQT